MSKKRVKKVFAKDVRVKVNSGRLIFEMKNEAHPVGFEGAKEILDDMHENFPDDIHYPTVDGHIEKMDSGHSKAVIKFGHEEILWVSNESNRIFEPFQMDVLRPELANDHLHRVRDEMDRLLPRVISARMIRIAHGTLDETMEQYYANSR